MANEDRDDKGQEIKQVMADFILNGDEAHFKAQLDRIGGELMKSINERLARELSERRELHPAKTYEELKADFADMRMMNAAEAFVTLREELKKWSEYVIECYIDPQVYTWIDANPIPGSVEPDKTAVRVELAKDLHAAILRKLSKGPE